MSEHERKSERVDRVKNNLWSEEDVLHWLPEVDYINDEELRDSTMEVFLYGCPESFMVKPSSSTGKYHSNDECGKYGNLIHTKRVFAEYCNLAESWLALGLISERDVEEGKSAALIHDMMKYGWPSEGRDHTTDEHDVIAAAVARNIGDLPDNVVRLVGTHMGSWGTGPEPNSQNAILLHTADKSAARASNDIGIYDPAEELLDEWPDLTVDEGEP